MGNIMTAKNAYDGTCVVFSTKDQQNVIKLPSKENSQSFMLEVLVLETIAIPKKCKMVEARVKTVTQDVLDQIPLHLKKRLWEGCVVSTPAIVMPKLKGETALDLHRRRALDVNWLADALVDHLMALKELNLYNTDIKLENLQCTAPNELTILDWGSICKPDDDMTYTFAVHRHKSDKLATMSVNVVCCLIELFEHAVVKNGVLTSTQYLTLRARALRHIHDKELHQKYNSLLAGSEHFFD